MNLVVLGQYGIAGVNCVGLLCSYTIFFGLTLRASRLHRRNERGTRTPEHAGRSANHAAGNGFPHVPHGRTLDWATVKTRRVLNTDVGRAPQAC